MKEFKWSSAKEGFVVDCLLMAGDADIFNVVTFKFSLKENDKMQRLLYAIESFHAIYEKYKEASFDSTVKAITKKSKLDKDEVESWFDDLLMLSDGDEGPVDMIIGYRISKADSSGSHYAMFDSNPYKILKSVSSEFFESWDLV